MIVKGATLAATDVTQLGTALSQASAAATALVASMKDLYSPTDSAKKPLSRSA